MPLMKNCLLEKIGGFAILIMVAFVLAVPIAQAKPRSVESISELRVVISDLEGQYTLVCGDNYGGNVPSTNIYAPDSISYTKISGLHGLQQHVTVVNMMMSYGWQPLGGTGVSCQVMIKE